MVIARSEFSTLIARIVEVIRPERVVLFGSHARGEAEAHSDVDLLVVADSNRPRYERAVPIYRAVSDLPFELDILVYTPTEVREWSRVDQAFVTTALREGRVVYERPR